MIGALLGAVVLARSASVGGESGTFSAPEGRTEELVGFEVERACRVVRVSGSLMLVGSGVLPPGIFGTYTLQAQTFDGAASFRQHTHLCTSHRRQGGHLNFTCPFPTLARGGAHAGRAGLQRNWIFYNAASQMWQISAQPLDGDGQPIAQSQLSDAMTPEQASGWGTGGAGARSLPSLRVECRDAKLPKTATPHGGTSREALRNMHVLDAKRDSKCLGWRKTAGCDPDGLREPEQDQKCHARIPAKASGYCQCASGEKHKVACGHTPFTCAEACVVTFPRVVAQSGERVWTNQLARNVLVDGNSDWLSSQVKNQWIIFDLGRPTAIDFVRFALWGSDANPHHVLLQTAPHYLGPWVSAAQFTVPLDVHRYDVPVTDVRAGGSRYWRLFIKDNWGAPWGVGFTRLWFISDAAAAKRDPCSHITSEAACLFHKSKFTGDKQWVSARCGWCAETGVCSSGNVDAPAEGNCPRGWHWNAMHAEGAANDACNAYGDCTSCSLHLSCGWCRSSGSCKSSGCKDWGERSCPQDQAGVSAALQRKLTGTSRQMYALGVAGAVLVLPVVTLYRRGRQGRSSARTAESSSQWDDEATGVLELDLGKQSYQGAGQANDANVDIDIDTSTPSV